MARTKQTTRKSKKAEKPQETKTEAVEIDENNLIEFLKSRGYNVNIESDEEESEVEEAQVDLIVEITPEGLAEQEKIEAEQERVMREEKIRAEKERLKAEACKDVDEVVQRLKRPRQTKQRKKKEVDPEQKMLRKIASAKKQKMSSHQQNILKKFKTMGQRVNK